MIKGDIKSSRDVIKGCELVNKVQSVSGGIQAARAGQLPQSAWHRSQNYPDQRGFKVPNPDRLAVPCMPYCLLPPAQAQELFSWYLQVMVPIQASWAYKQIFVARGLMRSGHLAAGRISKRYFFCLVRAIWGSRGACIISGDKSVSLCCSTHPVQVTDYEMMHCSTRHIAATVETVQTTSTKKKKENVGQFPRDKHRRATIASYR